MTQTYAAPGWYLDPDDETRQRYWNGSRWGSQTKRATSITPAFPDEDDEDELRTAIHVERTVRAARTLDSIAGGIIGIITIIAIAGVITGIVLLAKSQTDAHKIEGGVLIAGSAMAWLFSLLPYLAAQAIGRYIEYRVNEDNIDS